LLGLIGLILLLPAALAAQQPGTGFPLPRITFGVDQARQPSEVAVGLQVLLLLGVLSLAPAIILMVTSFVRISIVFSFTRMALGTQQMPPNQVLMGLALFITFFVMAPTLKQVNEEALQPFLNQKIGAEEFYNKGIGPVREFMFRQTREKDIALFMHLAKEARPKTREDVPTYVLVPAFMISEITTAFKIGILIFIPFIVIDMVIASTLMSMGMIMLPPVMVSLPFKIVLFYLVDGWNLLIQKLVEGFGEGAARWILIS
jgi:flagellar biosynthetic protein FliP